MGMEWPQEGATEVQISQTVLACLMNPKMMPGCVSTVYWYGKMDIS